MNEYVAQDKTRRIIYSDGDQEDLSLKEIRTSVYSYKRHIAVTNKLLKRESNQNKSSSARNTLKKSDVSSDSLLRITPKRLTVIDVTSGRSSSITQKKPTITNVTSGRSLSITSDKPTLTGGKSMTRINISLKRKRSRGIEEGPAAEVKDTRKESDNMQKATKIDDSKSAHASSHDDEVVILEEKKTHSPSFEALRQDILARRKKKKCEFKKSKPDEEGGMMGVRKSSRKRIAKRKYSPSKGDREREEIKTKAACQIFSPKSKSDYTVDLATTSRGIARGGSSAMATIHIDLTIGRKKKVINRNAMVVLDNTDASTASSSGDQTGALENKRTPDIVENQCGKMRQPTVEFETSNTKESISNDIIEQPASKKNYQKAVPQILKPSSSRERSPISRVNLIGTGSISSGLEDKTDIPTCEKSRTNVGKKGQNLTPPIDKTNGTSITEQNFQIDASASISGLEEMSTSNKATDEDDDENSTPPIDKFAVASESFNADSSASISGLEEMSTSNKPTTEDEDDDENSTPPIDTFAVASESFNADSSISGLEEKVGMSTSGTSAIEDEDDNENSTPMTDKVAGTSEILELEPSVSISRLEEKAGMSNSEKPAIEDEDEDNENSIPLIDTSSWKSTILELGTSEILQVDTSATVATPLRTTNQVSPLFGAMTKVIADTLSSAGSRLAALAPIVSRTRKQEGKSTLEDDCPSLPPDIATEDKSVDSIASKKTQAQIKHTRQETSACCDKDSETMPRDALLLNEPKSPTSESSSTTNDIIIINAEKARSQNERVNLRVESSQGRILSERNKNKELSQDNSENQEADTCIRRSNRNRAGTDNNGTSNFGDVGFIFSKYFPGHGVFRGMVVEIISGV